MGKEVSSQDEKSGKEEIELPEQVVNASLDDDGVIHSEANDVASLFLSRGYGERDLERNRVTYTIHEALYLTEKEKMNINNSQGIRLGFNELRGHFSTRDSNVWRDYVVFRDLRKRRYVVKEGFGSELRFRVFERGEFEKNAAKYLVVPVSEGKNIPVGKIRHLVTVCRSLKKEMIISVIDRRNEIVYYHAQAVDLKNI